MDIPSKLDLMLLIEARMEAIGMSVNAAAKAAEGVSQSQWQRFKKWRIRETYDEGENQGDIWQLAIKDARVPTYDHLFAMATAVGCEWSLTTPM